MNEDDQIIAHLIDFKERNRSHSKKSISVGIINVEDEDRLSTFRGD